MMAASGRRSYRKVEPIDPHVISFECAGAIGNHEPPPKSTVWAENSPSPSSDILPHILASTHSSTFDDPASPGIHRPWRSLP
jgi:hypothetical protein